MWRIILLVAVVGSGCAKSIKNSDVAKPWEDESVARRIVEPDLSIESMVPDDARWVIQINQLADWLDADSDDPLARHIWNVLQSFLPTGFVKHASANLSMTETELLRVYFGREAAAVDQKIDGEHGVVITSSAEPADLAKLPQALGLTALDGMPAFGPFQYYLAEGEENQYVFAIGQRWFMIGLADELDHLRTMVTAVAAGQPSVVDHPAYQALKKRLPPAADGLVLVRVPNDANDKKDDHHVVTLTREDGSVVADYAAEAPFLTEYIDDVETFPGVEFGPLPDSIVVAISANVLQRKVPGAGFLNFVLFPQNFNDDVRPSIAPPIVLYLASLSPDRVEPNPGVTVPVMGLSVRLNNPAVARHLDRIVRGMHFLYSTSKLNIAKSLFGIKTVHEGELRYQVADFGPLIQSGTKSANIKRLVNLPSSAGLTKIAFGRIGTNYVIATQEAFLRDWFQSDRQAEERLDASVALDEFALASKPNLLASIILRAPQMSALMNDIADYWKQAKESGEPALEETDPVENVKKDQDPIEQPLRWIAEGLSYRRSFSMQLWRDGKDILLGQVRIVEPNAEHTANR